MKYIAKKGRVNLLPNIDADATCCFIKNHKKSRSCLMCGKMFFSKGPYNRRCPKCSRLVYSRTRNGTLFIPFKFQVKSISVNNFIDDDFLNSEY